MNDFWNISNREVVYTNYPFCYSDLPSQCTLVHYDNFLYYELLFESFIHLL